MSKSTQHTFLFKAQWDATALKLVVEAPNLKAATLKAWGKVSRMEGGMSCLKVSLIQQLT